jgi:sulfonate transport system substrate-binding protein
MIGRRTLLAGIPALTTMRTARANTATTFRIGYQRNGILVVAKQQRAIEDRLRPLGVTVTWNEFSFGPPLLEAMRLDNLDFGMVGDTPPIFAQAAKAELVYVAALPDGGSSSAILLPAGSALRTLADLKGKRVAFARASAAHNLTVAALEKAGLRYTDIQPVQLAPADATAAFARGSVDAWTIWDPYYAIAETQPGVRILAKSNDITHQNSFYLSGKSYAQAHGHILREVIDELANVAAWANDHRDQVAGVLSDVTGVPLEAMQRAVSRSNYAVSLMTDDLVKQQQNVADRFHRLGLIPSPVAVADIAWRPTV